MNKEIIGTMLSTDSPTPIDGEIKGGTPYFTKADAMFCVGGMDADAWDYMQFVDVMINDKFMEVSSKCGLKIITSLGLPAKMARKIQLICEVALIESRTEAFTKVQRYNLIKTSESSWYRKYSSYYAMALDIYSDLDNKAGRHIAIKLGKLKTHKT